MAITVVAADKHRVGRIYFANYQNLDEELDGKKLFEHFPEDFFDLIIVDECHHVGAVSFDAILKSAKARYVLGLTATPIRRDGQQAIIFMQCGPIRHTAAIPISAPHNLEVVPRTLLQPTLIPDDTGIQDTFRTLAEDQERTAAIADEAQRTVEEGRKVLVLTERTDHLEHLRRSLEERRLEPFVLHGRMSKKQRANLIAELDALPSDSSRVLLATGRLVGEGFDHPPARHVSPGYAGVPGTLQQYAGRLHREHAGKTDVRIIDFVDTAHPALLRMWEKRQRGYRAMGYRIAEPSA